MESLIDMQDKIREFCTLRDWDQFHGAKDLAIGISTEANELLDIFRFKNDEQIAKFFDDEVKLEKISDELADTFFFVLRFAERYNIDLGKALDNKIKKNNKKYPAEKVRGSNLKYTDFE